MLETMYIVGFLGMMIVPIAVGIMVGRKLGLSWKLFLAGGITFIASQVPHIPLVLTLTPTFLSWGTIAYASILGLLAGLFEETARYILFKFILKKARTWNEGVFIGIGHGGTEAIILGIMAALGFVNMIVYRNVDLSTIPTIPPEQLELAKQQIASYWSAPLYAPLLGIVERISAMCLHVGLSVMVLYGLVAKQPIWFWLAVLWHAVVDGVAVYLGPQISILAIEGIIALFAVISLVAVFWLKRRFVMEGLDVQPQAVETETG